MDDLIARLEGASEGSRELDEDIAIAIGLWRPWLSKHRYWQFSGPDERRFHWPDCSIPKHDVDTGRKIDLAALPWHGWADEAGLPEWTESIDAALSLVPEGWFWSCGNAEGLMSPRPGPWANLYRGNNLDMVAKGAASALALCAAALRARASAKVSEAASVS